eukprot:1275892-Pyramimonas_sp.AAC.1
MAGFACAPLTSAFLPLHVPLLLLLILVDVGVMPSRGTVSPMLMQLRFGPDVVASFVPFQARAAKIDEDAARAQGDHCDQFARAHHVPDGAGLSGRALHVT